MLTNVMDFCGDHKHFVVECWKILVDGQNPMKTSYFTKSAHHPVSSRQKTLIGKFVKTDIWQSYPRFKIIIIENLQKIIACTYGLRIIFDRKLIFSFSNMFLEKIVPTLQTPFEPKWCHEEIQIIIIKLIDENLLKRYTIFHTAKTLSQVQLNSRYITHCIHIFKENYSWN